MPTVVYRMLQLPIVTLLPTLQLMSNCVSSYPIDFVYE